MVSLHTPPAEVLQRKVYDAIHGTSLNRRGRVSLIGKPLRVTNKLARYRPNALPQQSSTPLGMLYYCNALYWTHKRVDAVLFNSGNPPQPELLLIDGFVLGVFSRFGYLLCAPSRAYSEQG